MLKVTSILISCLFSLLNYGQNLDPKFAPFEGEVYRVPKKWRTKGYGPYLEKSEPFQKVKWNKLDTKDQFTDTPFRDINFDIKSFGVVLHSTMKIDQDGCYAFNLISDDGSRFWINDDLIINHDGDHGMSLKTDTVYIPKGMHKIKLWYYQAYPTNYGFIFEGKYIGQCPPPIAVGNFLESKIIFEHDEYKVKDSVAFISALQTISFNNVDSIHVLGFTNSLGSASYNQQLSQKRADSIASLLKSAGIQAPILAKGMGEVNEKILDNSIEKNKSNRRVNIKIFGSKSVMSLN